MIARLMIAALSLALAACGGGQEEPAACPSGIAYSEAGVWFWPQSDGTYKAGPNPYTCTLRSSGAAPSCPIPGVTGLMGSCTQ